MKSCADWATVTDNTSQSQAKREEGNEIMLSRLVLTTTIVSLLTVTVVAKADLTYNYEILSAGVEAGVLFFLTRPWRSWSRFTTTLRSPTSTKPS
ncbi:MAG: hypothetical protein ACUVXJ_06085 [Phycisphaerae bacterium]